MRNRKKKKPAQVRCRTHGPWKFEKTASGTKRTCTTCGFDVTEVPIVIVINPLTDKRSVTMRTNRMRREKEGV